MGERPRNYYNDEPSDSRYNRANYGSSSSRGTRSGWEEPTYRGSTQTARPARSSSARTQVPNTERDFDRQMERANREATRRSRSQSSNRARSTDMERSARATRTRTSSPEPQRKGGVAKRIIIGLLALLVAIGVGIAIYVNVISSNLHQGVTDEVRDVLVETEYTKEPFYMLLMGTDESAERNDQDYGGSFRSDSMMLVRIDCPNKKVTLISLERDTLVDLGEGIGWEKLNAASAWGGPALAIETVSKMAHDTPISHFALIDFDGFCAVVDTLGGIEVDVPIEIDDDDAGGYLAPGVQTLNGEQALILCRSRNAYENYGSGNTYRSANQRRVLSAIAQKILAADIGTIAATVSTLSNYISTDLEINDIIGLAQSMRGLDMSSDMFTAMQPTTAKYEDGMWFNTSDEPEWEDMLKRVDQGLPPTEEDVVDSTGTVMASTGSGEDLGGSKANVYLNRKSGTVVIRNGGAPSGSGSAAAAPIEDLGYDTDIGNASSSDYSETLVVFTYPSQRQDALQIAHAMGIGKVMLNNGDYGVKGDFLVVLGSDFGA